MAPSKKELEKALIQGTQTVFKEDPDTTSVNKVRKHVEEELELEDGFFTNEDWKQKSKELIKEQVEKLLDGGVPEAEAEPSNKNGAKPKANKPKKSESKPKPKPKKKAVVSDEDDLSAESSPSPSKKRKRKKVNVEEEDEEPSNAEDEENSGEDDAKAEAANESDEYSDVIDIVPAPKRKKKSKDDAKPASKPAAAAAAAAAAKKASSPEDSDETEIKKLQSQLTKCGVRKLWHNELKQYGDDSRAKMRHLRKMLTDVGMDGRFSEAKAREIKETRELLAEAEAAQEMNALWGMEAGGRSSRHKSRGVKMVESDVSGEEDNDKEEENNDDDDDDDEDEDEEFTFAARRRRAQADLAFLGDEDSDSD